MAFIGVDLHANSFTICRLEADGLETFQIKKVTNLLLCNVN